MSYVNKIAAFHIQRYEIKDLLDEDGNKIKATGYFLTLCRQTIAGYLQNRGWATVSRTEMS